MLQWLREDIGLESAPGATEHRGREVKGCGMRSYADACSNFTAPHTCKIHAGVHIKVHKARGKVCHLGAGEVAHEVGHVPQGQWADHCPVGSSSCTHKTQGAEKRTRVRLQPHNQTTEESVTRCRYRVPGTPPMCRWAPV